jgi:hypothetical protein
LIASCGCVVLVVECKKAQERALLFLRPVGGDSTGLVKTFTYWHLEQSRTSGGDFGVTLRDDKDLEPASYQAQFCVSTDKSGHRTLEQDARPVVLAADAVVKEFPRAQLPSRSFIVPVIVTTAPLYTLRFRPNEVVLASGGFNELDPKAIESISWVRFHKTLTAGQGSRSRTVFVVNSGALPMFLDEISRGQGLGPVH